MNGVLFCNTKHFSACKTFNSVELRCIEPCRNFGCERCVASGNRQVCGGEKFQNCNFEAKVSQFSCSEDDFGVRCHCCSGM